MVTTCTIMQQEKLDSGITWVCIIWCESSLCHSHDGSLPIQNILEYLTYNLNAVA